MRRQANKRRVVIVGGGVVGCATAFELARAGFAVALVERDAIAAHASGQNAGNLNPLLGTAAPQTGLAVRALDLHREVAAALRELGCANYSLAPVRRVHLGYDETDRHALQEIAGTGNAGNGFSACWLDRERLRRMEPRLAPDAGFGVLTEGSFSVSSYDLTCSLAQGAARLGASMIIGAATGVVTRNDRATAVQTSAGTIACDELVLATGPWVAETSAWLGVHVPVAPVKGQMLRLRLAGEVPAYDFTWQSTSLYKRNQHEVWAGGTMEHCGMDSSPTEAAKTLLLERAARIMPEVEQAELLEHTAALRPWPDSGNVIAEAARGWSNVYLANGGGGKGVLLSAAIARTLRNLLRP